MLWGPEWNGKGIHLIHQGFYIVHGLSEIMKAFKNLKTAFIPLHFFMLLFSCKI